MPSVPSFSTPLMNAVQRDLAGWDSEKLSERSAVLRSGGTLLHRKETIGGVTMALAAAPWAPDWRWQYDGT